MFLTTLLPPYAGCAPEAGARCRAVVPGFLSVLASALLFLQLAAPAAAQSGRWSEASTWPNGVPEAGDDVTIPAGQTVLLDEDTPALGHLRVEGTLRFEDARTLALTADWIRVSGRLEIGTEADPFAHEAVITLTGDSGDTLGDMGGKFLAVMEGGTLRVHGAAREKLGWTQLGATAEPGATAITLAEAPNGWTAGDEIVIAPSSLSPAQAEQVTITSVSGKTVSFAEPLAHRHYGELQRYGSSPERVLDERAEVGLLTRNVRIQGDEASTADGYGGHLMVHQGADAYVEGAEVRRMGQKGRKARYPLHWHRAGASGGNYVKNSSIHHNYNRCVTSHATDDLLIEGNVAYDTIGHCYFLEDGTETGNLIKDNLAVHVRRAAEGEAVLESDRYPAAFWTSNPNNDYLGNTAAGTEFGHGFWFGLSAFSNADNESTGVEMGLFRGNTSHSNSSGVDPRARGFHGGGAGLFIDQHQAEAAGLIEDFTTYKNRRTGIWASRDIEVKGAVIADSRTAAFGTNLLLEDALIVGRSAALREAELERMDRTEGLRHYDGPMRLKNATVAGFPGKYGLISWRPRKRSTDYYPPSYIENVEFVGEAKAVYLPSTGEEQKERVRTFVLRDRDGSITGKPGFVVYNSPIQLTEGCTVREEWRAAFCPEPGYFMPVKMHIGEGNAQKDFEFVRVSDGAVGYHNRNGTKLPGGRAYEVRLTSESMRTQYHRAEQNGAELWALEAGHWIELALPWKRSQAFLYRGSSHQEDVGSYRAVGGAEALQASDTTSYYVDEQAGRLHVKAFMGGQRGFEMFGTEYPAYSVNLEWCHRVRCRGPEVEGAPPPLYAEQKGTGLTGEYFAGDDFTERRVSRTDAGVAFDWGKGAPAGLPADEDFSVRWRGQVEAPSSGTYTYTVTHGEDVRLWIGNEQVIDAWDSSRFLNTSSGTIELEAGRRYDLRLEYRGGSHVTAAQLEWAYGDYESHTVPTALLHPSEEGGEDGGQVVAALNAGGAAHTTESGLVYEADARYSGGRTYSTSTAVEGTAEEALYQTERYGDFAYEVPVERAGTYRVTLRFAEVYWEEAGKRVFDVSVEGEALVSDLDLVAEAGPGQAYDVTHVVEVTDGRLDLAFSTDTDHAKLSALLVEEVAGSSAPSAVRLEGFSASASGAGASSISASGARRTAKANGTSSSGGSDARAAHLQWRTRSGRGVSEGLKGFRVLRKVTKGTGGSDPASAFEAVGFVESKAAEGQASDTSGTAEEGIRYRFLDAEVPYEAERVVYRLLQVGSDGEARQVGSDQVVEIAAPERFALEVNYPNPFREATTLRYRLKAEARVRLAVYDALGRKVRTLVGGERQGAGRRSVRFEARGLSSGTYFARLIVESGSGRTVKTRKLVLVR